MLQEWSTLEKSSSLKSKMPDVEADHHHHHHHDDAHAGDTNVDADQRYQSTNSLINRWIVCVSLEKISTIFLFSLKHLHEHDHEPRIFRLKYFSSSLQNVFSSFFVRTTRHHLLSILKLNPSCFSVSFNFILGSIFVSNK